MNRTILIVVAVLLILGVGAFFLLNKQNATLLPQLSPSEEPINEDIIAPDDTNTQDNTSLDSSDSGLMEGETKEIIVTGSPFKYEPSQIKVKKGDRVKITFKNAGGFHDFVLDEFNVKTKQINAGALESVTFTADRKGSFEYYCSVGNHRAQGMVGTLIVE